MAQSQAGRRHVLISIVRDHLFSRMKFVNKTQLRYSRSRGTVCQFVLQRLVQCTSNNWGQEKAEFWDECKNLVQKKLTEQRNNCIQAINKIATGE